MHLRTSPRTLLVPLSGLLLLVGLVPCASTARAGETAVATSPGIVQEDLEHRLAYIASEAMEGRETTKPGAEMASAYIASEFERLGLEPVAGDDGYFQPYAIARAVLGPSNELVVEKIAADGGAPATVSYVVEQDWNPFSVTANGEATGDVVFAGYGITAENRDWDDYAGLDVKGKVVLVLRKDPGWNDVRHAAFLSKLSNAASHGAAAVLLCNNPATTGQGPDTIGHWSAMLGAPLGAGKIPYAFVSQAIAEQILGEPLTQVELGLLAAGPQSHAVAGTRVRVRTEVGQTKDTNARNVAGLVRGTDPALAEEVVVLGAHYDHVGRGYFGSLGGASAAGRIHPGADDNGSGTVSLLELAEYFSDPSHRTRSSLLFLAFSGEEMGLLGSAHYVQDPLLPLEHVVAMLNMDMVGRSREGRLEVGGIGTGTGLKDIVAAANEQQGLSLSWDPQGEAPSDSTSFFRKKVPVLFFFTGLHEDYHRPSDTPDKINYPDMLRVVNLVRDVATTIGDRDERIVYTDPPPIPRPPRIGIQLGREPDPRGVLVGGVQPDGPAEAAGLQAGDVIVGLAGQIVRTPADLRNVLAKLKPGKAVEIMVVRGEERVTLELVPAERRGGR